MPVMEEPSDKPLVEKPNLVIEPEAYQTQVVDTRREAYSGLSTYLGGMKWACDYYSQIQGRDSSAASFQPDLAIPYGQYRLIKGFELVVQDALSGGQNSGGERGFGLTGSAVVYGIVTPLQGDVFVADIGAGRNAILQIQTTERKSIYAESPTLVTYRVSDYANAENMASLNSKVQETLYFSKENYRNGVKALLAVDEVHTIQTLSESYFRLMNLYLRDFYSERFHTLLVPTPDPKNYTYDPAAVRFVRSILSQGDHRLVAQIDELGVSHDVFSNEITLYDALLQRDVNLLYSAAKKFAMSPVSRFRTYPWMASIAYSGIRQVVGPTEVSFSVNKEGRSPHASIPFSKAGVRDSDIDVLLPQLGLIDEENKPNDAYSYIHRVVADEYYIFTKAFYEDTEGKSMLEQMVHDRLSGRAIDLGKLGELADYARKFDNLERFYYIPIILTLIKLAPGVL